jgi:hypothetical protein
MKNEAGDLNFTLKQFFTFLLIYNLPVYVDTRK